MILLGIFLMTASFIVYNCLLISDLKLLKTSSWYNERLSSFLFWLNVVLLVIGAIICFLHSIWVGIIALIIYFFVAPSAVSPIVYRICPDAKLSGKLPIWPIPKRRAANKIILSPKTTIGPDSSLKEFPLLYLYFDNFSDIMKAWREGYIEVAQHDIDIRSKRFTISEIMEDENLFLELYDNNLLRLKLNDDTKLFRSIEKDYWDDLISSKKYSDMLSSLPENAIKDEIERLHKLTDVIVQAIKLRYGL